jgi:hypothetical protein
MQKELATKTSNLTQVGLYEYLLVAHPDSTVRQKIVAEKQNFLEQYGQKLPVKAEPHISIANFFAHEPMEETVVRYMHRIISSHESFDVALNNYSGYPPHSIHLRIQDAQPLKQIGKDLSIISHYIKTCSCPPVTFISNPNISIGRKIPEAVYLRAMMDYSQKTFHDSFTVNELVMLRRSSEYDDCKAVHVFRLQPKGDRALANTLFN